MTKAKTVKARVAIAYDKDGHYQVEGHRVGRPISTDDKFIEDVQRWGSYPYVCMVEVELPIPKPLAGKVVKVKVVKP